MQPLADRAERAAQAPSVPTGTVTFLFTDIEGSTVRWERDRTAMARAVERHDALLRQAIESRGGYVFKTVGDAFCATFPGTRAAVLAAVEAQRLLAGEDWSAVGGMRVRMALHSGESDERDGDYFGPTVNRVARLLSIGHGGQILLSGATANLVRAELPAPLALLDCGEHRLKDLTEPERVSQLLAPDLGREFPALLSLNAALTNLPVQLTPLIGRDAELAQVQDLLGTARLVTLVGAGGVGKTRMALQSGAEVANDFSDGVWFVELAPLTDPALVVEAVAARFDVREAAGHNLLDSVVHALRAKKLLLILDNCEHVIAVSSALVRAILEGCPSVKILATSREAFGLPGEQLYRMPSLAVPPESERELTARDALSYGAVALFVQRAEAVQRSFSLDDRNAPIVARICRQLDGIALAIELAAAKVAVLSPRQVSDRLSERFRLLTGGDRTVLPRQQTMRAAIDWSYELLSEAERTVLQRLAIFADGCTLEAAGAICSDERVAEWDVLELLSSLAAKSLVFVERNEDASRYGMLQSTREYALEKLTESGEAERLARAHAAYFLALALEGEAEFPTTSDLEWFGRYEPELGNYRAALARTLGDGSDPSTGVALAGAIMPLWRGPFRSEGRRWLKAAEAAFDRVPDAGSRAKTLHAIAWLGSSGRDRLLAAERAVAAFRAIDDPAGLSRALGINALSLAISGRPAEGLVLAEEALELARRIGAARTIASTFDACATIAQLMGDLERARVLHEQALEVSSAIDTPRQRAMFLCNLAEVEFELGDGERALALAREALVHYRRFDDRHAESLLECNVAAYSIAAGALDEARRSARSAVLALRDQHQTLHLAIALEHLAVIAALDGNLERAARLSAYTDRVRCELEVPRQTTEQLGYDRLLKMLEGAAPGDIERWREQSALLGEDATIAFALAD